MTAPSDAPPTGAAPAAAGFIVVTVAIDAMGIGLILPVMPELLAEIGGLSVSEAALWGGRLAFAYAIMQFLCGPLLGMLSDRYGRRPVLLLSLAALAVDYVVMSLAGTLWLLVLTRVIAGAAGSSFATANAWLADVSPPERRAANFGLVGAGFGVGFVLGPALGGVLGEWGPRAPFLAAAALAAANMACGAFVLPESLPRARRRALDLRRADPISQIRGDRGRCPRWPRCCWGLGVYALAHAVYPAVWAYYALAALRLEPWGHWRFPFRQCGWEWAL
jgi:Arabinose efflux permease